MLCLRYLSFDPQIIIDGSFYIFFYLQAGIPIFVTGGIGGVHRGAETTFDVSADLTELGNLVNCKNNNLCNGKIGQDQCVPKVCPPFECG